MKISEVREKVSDLNVLYVEDEQDIREDGAHFFQRFFATVTTASNGQEAIDLLEKSSYDLILSDLKMPKCNGDELFEYVQNHFSSVPMIIISGLSPGDGILLAKYPYRLEKPWSIESFIELLDSIF